MIATYSKGEEGFLEGYEKNILGIGGKTFGIVLRYILEQSQKDATQGEGNEVKGCVWNCHSEPSYFFIIWE